MGSSQSTPAAATSTPTASSPNGSSANDDEGPSNQSSFYPKPTGHEYDAIDKIASELPNVIDDESRQQVEDYRQACDNGKGPMVACFASAEYISLFERRHKDAADLYENVCFRPATDKSPNGMAVDDDGTKAYPAGCFNLAKMLLTGKGGVACDRPRAYRLLDRACRTGHGGACYLQAQILCSRPGALGGPDIPHNPAQAMDLYQHTCDEHGDSIACYTLATMLLRGDKVTKAADNVSPQEARGLAPVVQRENEPNRARSSSNAAHSDVPYTIARDPARAEQLLLQACHSGAHVTSCHNLAVMYQHGDDGVAADPAKAEKYKKLTQEKMSLFGGF